MLISKTSILIIGTRYVGEFLDGRFHGKGTLHMTTGASMKGIWNHGKMTESELTFKDGLKFEDSEDWSYCQGNDRRFYTEQCNGLKPAGRSQLTNIPREIPDGHYDTGDGFYDPIKREIVDYDGKFARNADEEEHEWIITNCRKAWDEFVGYKQK